MKTVTYKIAFDFHLGGTGFSIPLTAEAELHHSQLFYIITNFRTVFNHKDSVLPEVHIKRLNQTWVHCESNKESELSLAIGRAIDVLEMAS